MKAKTKSKLIKCPGCGAEIGIDEVNCPYCGRENAELVQENINKTIKGIRNKRKDVEKIPLKAFGKTIIIMCILAVLVLITAIIFGEISKNKANDSGDGLNELENQAKQLCDAKKYKELANLVDGNRREFVSTRYYELANFYSVYYEKCLDRIEKCRNSSNEYEIKTLIDSYVNLCYNAKKLTQDKMYVENEKIIEAFKAEIDERLLDDYSYGQIIIERAGKVSIEASYNERTELIKSILEQVMKN